ncbi:MAG: hypothetical protein C0506_13345, partial [Anaerolinea sp.]|nr:hypothetical protein [Anaerolinea sp.]
MTGFDSPGLLLHLLDITEDQVYAVDFDTASIIECNEGAQRALGYSRKELIGLTLWDLDAALSPDKTLQDVRDLFGQLDVTMTVRSRHRRKDGSTFPVEIRGRTSMIDGHPIQIAICRDITAQRMVERQLEDSRRQLELLVRSLPGVVYRYELGPPARVLWLDDRFETLTGFPAEEFRSGERTLASLVAPEDYERVAREIRALADSGGGALDLTYELVQASGARRIIRDSATVAPGESPGDPPTVEGITFDVTERVEQERVLRDAWLAEHERYEFVVAASGQIVYEWDIANERISWGGSLKEVLGFTELQHHYAPRDALARVHPEDRARVIQEVRGSVSTLGRVALEYRHRHADGGYRWVWHHAVYEHDASGKPVRAAGVLQDITQRKQLDAQISSAQRMETIGALAGGVAHDVNNYLTTILGNVDIALMRLGDRSQWPELE